MNTAKYHIVRRHRILKLGVGDERSERIDLAFGGEAMSQRMALKLADGMNQANRNGPAWMGTYFTVPAPFAGEA
jgi:hypothetical protein